MSLDSCGVFQIAIADDHPVVSRGLEVLLESRANMKLCGHAASALELERLLEVTNPDLLILDLSLGSAYGVPLLHKLRSEKPTLKVIVFSMYSDAGVVQAALAAGASAYVCKQDPPADLLAALDFVLDGGQRGGRAENGIVPTGSCNALPETLLTPREVTVFELLGDGHKTSEIAARLFVSVKTIESHRENIKAKLDLTSAQQLIAFAARTNAARRGFQMSS